MDRSNKEIKLPISEYRVAIYDYYLHADVVAIQRIMTDAVDVTADGKITNVDTSYRYTMEDESILRAIASVKTKDGLDVVVSKEMLGNLPEEDYEFLKENLPKQKEKKSTTKPLEGISEKPQKNGE